MLTRIYIDNFRCFEKFEYKPGPKQLILGANGSGKSSLMDALWRLREFVTGNGRADQLFTLKDRTRWLDQTDQTFEVETKVAASSYRYELVIGTGPVGSLIQSEMLERNGVPILRFDDGWAKFAPLGLGDPWEANEYPLDPYRSAIANFPYEVLLESGPVKRFRDQIADLGFFRLNPFSIRALAEPAPTPIHSGFSNFANWYRYVRVEPQRDRLFQDSLRESLESFNALRLEDAGADVMLLVADFRRDDGQVVAFRFDELSEGQRCLICLYAILHFIVDAGYTVVIDEPENFIGLREMQPWLMSLSMSIEDHGGQAILISHHPEFLNQWAGEFGQRFVREGAGPVQIKPLNTNGYNLTVAELIARGWEDD